MLKKGERMKKLLTLLQKICKLEGEIPCFYADDEAIEFEPVLTNRIGYDTDKWYGSDASRAALAGLLMIDFGTAFDHRFAFEFYHAVYIGRIGERILVGFYRDIASLVICYHSVERNAAYYLSENRMGGALLEKFFEKNCDSHDKINAMELIDFFTEVSGKIQ